MEKIKRVVKFLLISLVIKIICSGNVTLFLYGYALEQGSAAFCKSRASSLHKNLTVSFYLKFLFFYSFKKIYIKLKNTSQATNFGFEGRIWPAGRSLPTPVLK